MKQPTIVKQILKTEIPEINFAFQKNISYSQLSMYKKCPHQWALMYKDGHKRFTSSIHTVFGTAMHETIQHYLDVMYNESIVAADKIDLEELFNTEYIKEYQNQMKSNNNEHFSSAIEMREFFDDGVAILDYFKRKRSTYFSKRKTHLVGVELPIVITPNPSYKNTIYKGYLDLVLYNENSDTFTIIDIKTSTRGWKDREKTDETKLQQLVLYKKFFAEQYNIPLEKIDVEFFIVKRKVFENKFTDAEPSRIQSHKPAAGRNKLNLASRNVQSFITECFTSEGKYKERKFDKNPSKWNCGFCPYKNDKELCGLGDFQN